MNTKTPFPVPTANRSASKAGHLYVAYADKAQNADPNDLADVFFLRSTDGGATWTTRERISTVSNNDQWMPMLAVKPDGTQLFAAWYDRRIDSYNNLIDLYGRWGTIASDGTVTFGTELKITTTSFAPTFAGDFSCQVPQGDIPSCKGNYDPVYSPGHVDLHWRYPIWPETNQSGFPITTAVSSISHHVGEYNGVFADNSNVYVSWGDNRLISAPSELRNQSDIRFTKFNWPP